jgi:hypothetical protein
MAGMAHASDSDRPHLPSYHNTLPPVPTVRSCGKIPFEYLLFQSAILTIERAQAQMAKLLIKIKMPPQFTEAFWLLEEIFTD